MPEGPQGQKRPADVIGSAVRVMRIATGESRKMRPRPARNTLGRGGLIGGPKRAAKLNRNQRAEIARKAVQAR